MRPNFHAFVWFSTVAIFFVPQSVISFGIGPQSLPNSAVPAPQRANYFPPGAVDGFSDYFSSYLTSIGEPSLYSAAQDHDLVSYRMEWLSGQGGQMLAVRLSVNSDGTGTLTVNEHFPAPTVPTRTQKQIPVSDVKKFLQVVEESGFWQMRTHDPDKPDVARKTYKLDASTAILEGVSNGKYQIVFRRAPTAGPFANAVRFFARDIANLDQAAFPDLSPPPPASPANASDQDRQRQ